MLCPYLLFARNNHEWRLESLGTVFANQIQTRNPFLCSEEMGTNEENLNVSQSDDLDSFADGLVSQGLNWFFPLVCLFICWFSVILCVVHNFIIQSQPCTFEFDFVWSYNLILNCIYSITSEKVVITFHSITTFIRIQYNPTI